MKDTLEFLGLMAVWLGVVAAVTAWQVVLPVIGLFYLLGWLK